VNLINWTWLATLNASLNFTSAVLLSFGYWAMRTKRILLHACLMIAAFSVSVAFLISYVIYHVNVGSVPYQKHDWTRPLYFAILISHVTLAATVPVLATMALSRGLRGNIERHRAIARWTWPIWMYVSVTGVIVYVMLYRYTGV